MSQHTNIVIIFGIPFYKRGNRGEGGGWDMCVCGEGY